MDREHEVRPRNLVIFDIDGCLVEPQKPRIDAWLSGDFKGYVDLHHTDVPIAAGLQVCRSFIDNGGFRVMFITGRGDAYGHRQATIKQLEQHLGRSLLGRQMLMRQYPIPESEKMPDHEWKPKALLDAGYDLSEVFLVLEDRPDIVKAWRELGVTCYQSQEGW